MERLLESGSLKINTLLIVFISLFILSPTFSLSQDYDCYDCLQKQRKVNLELIGVSYQVETPIRSKFTNISRVGLQYSFMLTSGNIIEKYYYSLDAVISSGVRYYYHMSNSKRNNSGQFFQVDAGVKSGSLISKNMYYPAYLYLRPHWGIQFSAKDWGSLEFATGFTVGSSIIENYKGIAVAPNIQFRIGYLLKSKNKKVREL